MTTIHADGDRVVARARLGDIYDCYHEQIRVTFFKGCIDVIGDDFLLVQVLRYVEAGDVDCARACFLIIFHMALARLMSNTCIGVARKALGPKAAFRV
ncbi:hypothetical protein DWV00_11705 [Trinickia dinghuensis]|uniref:Uncharacterized protein n=1 Tax=Trinickia dinghuensis TaxID=2291023 RepID=A0A3D8K0V5_9BURK|nr:hypothetical protein DWV00_11705 [Trinickia dinghuensis]